MTNEQFIYVIRLGIHAGAYDKDYVLQLFKPYGCGLITDVPLLERKRIVEQLDARAIEQ